MKQKIHILFLILILTSITSLYAQNDSASQRITLRDIPASIIPPKHFEYDSISDRLSHEGTMSSIHATIVKKRNFKQITSAMTSKYMKSQGFELLERQETTMQNGEDAEIFRCRFRSHDANGKELDFIRLMLFSGKENTLWITADFPECIATQIEEPVTESIKTTKSEGL